MSVKHDDLSALKPNSSGSSPVPYDAEADQRVLRKCDLHVVPILYTLYLLSYLDRINIGNARIEGLEKDLGMSGNDYNIAVQIFFIPYILMEVPSNIAMRRVTPSTWLSAIMFFWGKYARDYPSILLFHILDTSTPRPTSKTKSRSIADDKVGEADRAVRETGIITMCQGFVSTFGGLVACRFLLGLFESGLAPGALYLITTYYRRYELQKRYTLYNTAGIISGAFGGFLAYALVKMDGLGGYAGWRWIFIVERLLTTVVAVLAKWLIVDWPENAKFLNDEDRSVLVQRLKNDISYARMDRLDRAALRRILGDWKVWAAARMYLGTVTSTYSVSYYLPTVLNEFGYTASDAQVQTIPIYAAALVAALATAWFSDRLRHRFGFVMLGAAVNVIGYAALLGHDNISVKAKYMSLYFVVCGLYIGSPVEIQWVSSNFGGHYKRAIGSAVVGAVGNMSGFIASNVFITEQSPRYPVGYGVTLGMTVFAAVAATALFLGYKRENRRRDRGERDYRLEKISESGDNLGDYHPNYRYAI